MSAFTYSKTTSAKLIMWLLLPALLLAQWVGFEHRIVHADWQDSYQVQTHTTSTGKSTGANAKHSCSAIDAATLAACLSSAAFKLPEQNEDLQLADFSFHSWLSQFYPHFSSRAPPQTA